MVTHEIALGPEFDFLPDDTEESLLGTPLHQLVIVTLFNSLMRFARRTGLPWFVGNQTKLLLPRRGARVPYQPSPDITVHPTLGTPPESSLDARTAGPPALVIEVASPATARAHDLDTLDPRAKPGAYAAAGIAEYLAYDPTGDIIPERVRAWRMGDEGVYVAWLPEADGRWHSRALGISFAPLGLLLRVYGPDGELVPNNEDMDALLAASRREAAERDEELAAMRRENEELRARLRQQQGEAS
jgi:Uma2 family endonuclease